MRNPDSLNVGEPGSRKSLERRHPNRPPTHFAIDLLFRAVSNARGRAPRSARVAQSRLPEEQRCGWPSLGPRRQRSLVRRSHTYEGEVPAAETAT